MKTGSKKVNLTTSHMHLFHGSNRSVASSHYVISIQGLPYIQFFCIVLEKRKRFKGEREVQSIFHTATHWCPLAQEFYITKAQVW